jgi:hypothetical protein
MAHGNRRMKYRVLLPLALTNLGYSICSPYQSIFGKFD